MVYKLLCLLGGCLLLVAQSVMAEIKYVTDDLKLALYEEEGSKGKLLQRLPSGTRLEVLEESGLFAKVQTPDGIVGWTKAGFLMSEKPARARLLALEQEQAELQKTLKETQAQLATSNQLAKALRAEKIQTALELAGHKESRLSNDDLIAGLTKKNSDLQDRIQYLENSMPTAWSIPWHWGLIGTMIALLLGLIAGFALFDWLSRRRHGGYRIY